MAKKNKGQVQAKPAATVAPKTNSSFTLNSNSFFPLLGCLLYFVVHFIPDMGGYDAMGIQWIYLVLLDLAIILYLLAKKNDYLLTAARVFNNTFSKLYIAFFVLAGISIITAINPTEGCVCFVRLTATIIAYFNLTLLLQGRNDLFKILAQVLGIILFIEACQTLSIYSKGVADATNTETYTLLIMSLKGEAGNKNIFAAGLVAKVPFVLYGIHRFKLLGKIFNMVTLVLASLAIFLVNARATYLSLILVLLMYIVYCIIDHLKEKKLEKTLYRIGFVIAAFAVAFLIDSIAVTKPDLESGAAGPGNFGTATERLASIGKTSDESNQVRFRLWAHAIDYTKHHPLMGCGIGNWKIASIPYQRTITNDLYVPIHAHNDYLEVFAELGVLGGLLYLSLFICLIVFTFKTFYSKADEETKLVSVFSLMALSTYAIDALFNFPIERPISQVFFAFMVAVNVGSFIKGREELSDEKVVAQKANNSKIVFAFISIFLLIPSFYVTYQTYQSLILQKTVLGDLNNEPLRMDYSIVKTFPSIPNLTATAQPILSVKGRYLYEAGKYDEALVLLNKGQKDNPVIGYSEFLKAGLYYRKDTMQPGKHWIDSAFSNGMKAFYTRPKAKTYYQTLVAILARMKDTTTLKKVFAEYDLYRHHSFGWDMFLRGMLNAEQGQGKIMPNLLTYVDSGLQKFPADTQLLLRRTEIANALAVSSALKVNTAAQIQSINQFNAATAAYNAKQLARAADLFLSAYSSNPANFNALENAAMCYFNLNQFDKAIAIFNKELALKVSFNGKPEFYKGVCMLNLNQPDGCTFLKISKAKGYKEKEAELNAILKQRCGQ